MIVAPWWAYAWLGLPDRFSQVDSIHPLKHFESMFFLLLTLLFGTAFVCWLLQKRPSVAVVRLDCVEVIVPVRGCHWKTVMLVADRRSISDGLVDRRGCCLGMGRIASERPNRHVLIALRCVKELLRAYTLFSFCPIQWFFDCPIKIA